MLAWTERDEEKEEEEGGGLGLAHQTKVAPIEAQAPHTLQIFTPYIHMHTRQLLFSTSLSAPLIALDVGEGRDVRERIHTQISMTVTTTTEEC